MARKPKSDLPVFMMRVEKGGRLSVVGAWDEEALSTYRIGSVVAVHITQEKSPPKVRRYWQILNILVKSGRVGNPTAKQLHIAVQRDVGNVEPYFDMSTNKVRTQAAGTSHMSSHEFDNYFREAMDEIHRQTGIDPETLNKEAKAAYPDDPAEDDEDQQPVDPDQNAGSTPADDTEGNAAAADGEGEDQTATGDAGSSPNEIADGAGDQPNAVDSGGSESGTTDAPADPVLTDEEWLKRSARMVWAASWKFQQSVLKAQVESVAKEWTPPHITQAARDKLSAIYKECRMVAYGEVKREDVLPKVAAIAGVEPAWLNQDERRKDVT